MMQQTYLSQIEEDERALKEEARAVSEQEYLKLVAHHLHLIARSKQGRRATRTKQRRFAHS